MKVKHLQVGDVLDGIGLGRALTFTGWRDGKRVFDFDSPKDSRSEDHIDYWLLNPESTITRNGVQIHPTPAEEAKTGDEKL